MSPPKRSLLMKNRHIFLRLLAVIMGLTLAAAMMIVASAEEDEVVIQPESEGEEYKYENGTVVDYESDFVIRYEGESIFWYEGESFTLEVGSGVVHYETNMIWMWVCSCGKTNSGETCPECGEARPEGILRGAFVADVATETEAPTILGKAEDLLGCGSTVAVGSIVAVAALAGVCLIKRKEKDD